MKNMKNIDLKHLTTPLHSTSNVNLQFSKILETISFYKKKSKLNNISQIISKH